MSNKGLITFQHGDIAYSDNGTPQWNSPDGAGTDVEYDPRGRADRFKPDWNQLFACNCSHLLVALHPDGEDITTTAAVYPGTPDRKWIVQPWRGKYLEIQMIIERTGAAGTMTALFNVSTAGFNQDVGSQSTTGGPERWDLNVDLSSLGGNDYRGLDGHLNLFLKTTGGTAKLKGLSAFQHNVSGTAARLWL